MWNGPFSDSGTNESGAQHKWNGLRPFTDDTNSCIENMSPDNPYRLFTITAWEWPWLRLRNDQPPREAPLLSDLRRSMRITIPMYIAWIYRWWCQLIWRCCYQNAPVIPPPRVQHSSMFARNPLLKDSSDAVATVDWIVEANCLGRKSLIILGPVVALHLSYIYRCFVPFPLISTVHPPHQSIGQPWLLHNISICGFLFEHDG